MYAYVTGNGQVHATTLDGDMRPTSVATPSANIFNACAAVDVS
jgi:hypothetical protein